MHANPYSRAIHLLKSGNGSAAAIQAAATLVTDSVFPTIKGVVKHYWAMPLLNRIMERDDMDQECQYLLLTTIVNKYQFPGDLPDDERRVRRSFGAFTGRCLRNHWSDRVRHIRRNGTLRTVSERTIENEGGDGFWTPTNFVDILLGGQADEEPTDIFAIAKERLAETDYIILRMRYQGESTTEIGNTLGITRHAVQDRVRQKIRPAMKRLLGSHFPALAPTTY